jgi:hypothetical protein
MTSPQRCTAINGRFCSGETPADECLECMEFVTTCDDCHMPGSNDCGGWHEGPDGRTLCEECLAACSVDDPFKQAASALGFCTECLWDAPNCYCAKPANGRADT